MSHEIDRLVGARIREGRTHAQITQTELAESVGCTFQQIQKYETGYNRVSCSRLWMISQTLNLPITFFFGVDSEEKVRLISTDEAKVLHAFRDLDLKQKRIVRELLEAMVA